MEEYWDGKFRTVPKSPNIGRVKHDLPILANGRAWSRAKTITFDMGKEQAGLIEERGGLEGVCSFMVLNAAFLQTIAEVGSTEDVVYWITLRRSDGQLANYAGHHTLHPLMHCRHNPARSLADFARDTAEKLLLTVENLPAAESRRSAIWDQQLLDAGSYRRQIVSGLLMPSAH